MKFYKELLHFAEKGPGGVIVCTLVESSGSVPRHVGTKMAVNSRGESLGTIGGGSLELTVIQRALRHLESGVSMLEDFDLASLEDASPMMCGGKARIFFEVLQKPVRLFLFGAGHVGRALAPLIRNLPFSVVVVDHRKEMLDAPEFEGCEKVFTDYRELAGELKPEPGSFAVIATPDHQHDFECLSQMISQPLGYLGMIASKKKRSTMFSQLREKGVPVEMLERVASPIGLQIGSETPYEIGLSIAAEIVATLRRAPGGRAFKTETSRS